MLVDAAGIFLNLSRGKYYPFPEAFEAQMEIIGGMIAHRAILERRHIVTELIGKDMEPTQALLLAMKNLGYLLDLQAVVCEEKEARRRNNSRGDDCISAYYAEKYQRKWLLEAASGE